MENSVIEKLAQQAEEQKEEIANAGGNKNSILVYRAVGFNRKSRISDKDEEINANEDKVIESDYPLWNELQYIVGYTIKNIGDEPIRDIINCKYKKDEATGLYVGEETKEDLAPGKTMIMKTKYLALLSLRPEFNKQFYNGKFIDKYNELAIQKGDWDAVLASFKFRKNDNWDDVSNKPTPSAWIESAGWSVRDINTGKVIRWEIVEDKFKERFGNMCNPIVKIQGREKNEDIPLTMTSAMYVGALLNLLEWDRANAKKKAKE